MQKDLNGLPQDSSTVTTPPVNPPADPPDIDALFKALSNALTGIDEVLQPFDITINPEEVRRLIFIEKGRDGYLEAGNLHNNEDGLTYLSQRKTEALRRHYRLWKELEPIAQRVDQVRQRIRILQATAGSRAYLGTSDLEKAAFSEGKQGDLKAREIAADLVSKRPYTGNKRPDAGTSDVGSQTTPKVDAGAQTLPTADIAV